MTQSNTNGKPSHEAHDPSEPSYKHVFECSHCRGSFEKVKMCSACKVVGYCSRTCQKKDWKEHKHYCKGRISGKPALGRDPVMKVTERFMDNGEIRSWVKALLFTVLDLANHPENSTKYAVTILAGASPAPTDTGVTIPSQQRKKIPMLFHIVKATLFEDAEVDIYFPGLKFLRNDINRKLDELLQGIERQKVAVVRAVWVSKENPSAIQMFCDHINDQESAFIQRMHFTPESIIRHINAQPQLHPDIRELFTIRTRVD